MKCAVVGYGRFGKLWVECLSNIGCQVLVYTKNPKKIKNKKIKMVSLNKLSQAEIIFLAVPISEMKNCCRSLTRVVDSKTLIVDTCSVKMIPVQIMKKEFKARQPLVGTHPLFGPDSVARLGLEKQKIVVCPIRISSDQMSLLNKLFKKMKLKIILSTARIHDLQMAKSQALVHFVGRGLSLLKLVEQKISTPDYQSLRQMNSMVENDTWKLFFDMQKQNPYSKKIRQSLLTSLNKLNNKIEKYGKVE